MYQARLLKKIKGTIGTGITAGIKELSETPEFLEVFHAEVARRGLVPKDVTPCIPLVYHEASKHAHGNDSMITVRVKDHTPNELAALACFLILQSKWPDALAWRQVEEDEETTGEVVEDEEKLGE